MQHELAMQIAFIGAGRLAQTFAAAFHRAGLSVTAVASRSRSNALLLAETAPGCYVADTAQEAADRAEITFITVPDDAISLIVREVRWRPGQYVVHCSGATEVSALAEAAEQGADIGGFHPLQLFADPTIALAGMAGCSVAIEAGEMLEAKLRRCAIAVGYRPITLPPGVRGRYHAATNFAASLLLSLLREACDLWNAFGVDDKDALAALLPLARGTLVAAEARGLSGAMAGPISRGDCAVVEMHLRDLSEASASCADLYRRLCLVQLRLAREKGQLDHETLARLQVMLHTQ